MDANKDGTYGKAKVAGYILELQATFEFPEDSFPYKLLKANRLLEDEKELKAAIKKEATALHLKTKATIEGLVDARVSELLHQKWIIPLSESLLNLPAGQIEALAHKLESLTEKYRVTYSDNARAIHEAEKALSSMIEELDGGEYEMKGLVEFKRILDGGAQQSSSQQIKNVMLGMMFPENGESEPKVRFKGFDKPWGTKPIKEIADKVLEKNGAMEFSETFTNSAEHGIVSQRDYFDKSISNAANLSSYYVVRNGDFVYNPRISINAPVGPINLNKLGRTGVMSPLYTVFRTRDVDLTFLEYYFRTRSWHPFMLYHGDTGARADRFSIKLSVFMELPIPSPDPEEQQKIGEYFRRLDELISKSGLQLEKLKQLKTACLEKMFV